MIPKLNESKKKFSHKRIIGILAPWLGILVLALAVSLISNIGGKEETPVNVSVSSNEAANRVISEIMDLAESRLPSGEDEGNPVFDLVFGLPKWVWLLALVLYVAVYIPFIMQKSRNRFCDEVAGYLTPELEQFLQEADFPGRMAENCESLRTEAEQACQEILTVVLDKTEIPKAMQVRSESEEFRALYNRWESIRKTV